MRCNWSAAKRLGVVASMTVWIGSADMILAPIDLAIGSPPTSMLGFGSVVRAIGSVRLSAIVHCHQNTTKLKLNGPRTVARVGRCRLRNWLMRDDPGQPRGIEASQARSRGPSLLSGSCPRLGHACPLRSNGIRTVATGDDPGKLAVRPDNQVLGERPSLGFKPPD